MSFNNFRFSHPGHRRAAKRADSGTPNASCKTGGFYKSPSNGGSYQSNQPLALTWDTTCLTPTPDQIDIYLYAPASQGPNARLHMWTGVPHAPGSYNLTLQERWWNATATVSLQLAIINSGMAPFLSQLPAGPVFTIKYTKPADGSTPQSANLNSPADTGITQASNLTAAHTARKLPGGKTAVAVLLPLLAVIIAVIFYIRYTRKRGIERRKRWSQAIDKRMSTISTDWKSLSAAGANAAIRASMAEPGTNRASMAFSFGGIRPSSTISTADSGQAGVGAGAPIYNSHATQPQDQMSQLRPGARVATPSERVSRVSFAADPRPSGETSRSRPSGETVRTRPSGESRRNVPSRAFHSAFIPPVPEREDSEASDHTLSPRQTDGALPLTSEEIRARIDGEIAPALRMMRTGTAGVSPSDADFLLPSPSSGGNSPTSPAPPYSPSYPTPPASALAPSSPRTPETPALSPDALLRAYAERGGAQSGFPAPPAASYHGGGMRVLYAPSSAPTIPTPIGATVLPSGVSPMRRAPSINTRASTHRAVSVVGEEMERYRKSIAVSSRYSGETFDEDEEDEDDMTVDHIGTAE